MPHDNLHNVPEPGFAFMFEVTATLDKPQELGMTKYGKRRVIGINGGTFEGPGIKGVVIPGGADWQTLRTDGTADLVANYCLRTDKGETIYIENAGIRTAPAEVLQRLANGDDVDPSEYYMRTAAKMEINENSDHNYLNTSIIVSSGIRKANSVIIRFYRVL